MLCFHAVTERRKGGLGSNWINQHGGYAFLCYFIFSRCMTRTLGSRKRRQRGRKHRVGWRDKKKISRSKRSCNRWEGMRSRGKVDALSFNTTLSTLETQNRMMSKIYINV